MSGTIERLSKWKTKRGTLQRISTEMMPDNTIVNTVTCPICKKYLTPPTVSCDFGHLFCTQCKTGLKKCPQCGTTSFPNRRNAVFDKMLLDIFYPCVNQENGCMEFHQLDKLEEHQNICCYVKVPCRFQPDGCNDLFILPEKEQHEQQCRFSISCKILKKSIGVSKVPCDWRGSRKNYSDHVRTNHQSLTWLPDELDTNVEFPWMVPLGVDFESVEFLELLDVSEIFNFFMKTAPNDIQYLAIQHIGNTETAEEFHYSVQFRHMQRTLTFINNVLPETVDDVYADPNCCAVSYNCLKHHFQAERVVDCYIKIFKHGQSFSPRRRIQSFMGNTLSRDDSHSNRNSLKQVIQSMKVFDESNI